MAKKASFAAASFSNLRAAAGEGAGEPLRIALLDIDEDPNQPRKAFDQAELEAMAVTIRDKGVLQPIGVTPPEDGRYMLVFGARRLRASKLAGQTDIPAVIVPAEQRDYATQVIENQQRANLSNSELAAAVNQLHAEGRQGKEIAAICNLRDYQIAAFRAVEKLPDFLRSRMDHGDIRAIYDLYRAWQKHPEARVQDAMPERDTFLTITEARRIIGAVTGKATGSIILDRQQAPEAEASASPQAAPALTLKPAPVEVDNAPASTAVTDVETDDTAPQGRPDQPERTDPNVRLHVSAPVAVKITEPGLVPMPNLTSPPASTPAATAPVFIMAALDGRQGELVTDERPREPGWVYLNVDDGRIETPFIELRAVNAK